MQTSRRKEWSDRTSCKYGETRNPRKSRSSRKASLQLNGWKRVMQGSRTNRMMRLQRSRTSRRMLNCDGCILWIEFSKMVESGDMDKLWKQKASLNFPMWSWLELRSAKKGSESRAHGVATSTSLWGELLRNAVRRNHMARHWLDELPKLERRRKKTWRN